MQNEILTIFDIHIISPSNLPNFRKLLSLFLFALTFHTSYSTRQKTAPLDGRFVFLIHIVFYIYLERCLHINMAMIINIYLRMISLLRLYRYCTLRFSHKLSHFHPPNCGNIMRQGIVCTISK